MSAKKLFCFCLFSLFLFASCETLITKDSEYYKELLAALQEREAELSKTSVTVSYKFSKEPTYVSADGKIYFNSPVDVIFTYSGTNFSCSLNNEQVNATEKVSVSKEGRNYLLAKASDSVERTAYCAVELFIDTTAPVINFVNTASQLKLGTAIEDNLPDNCITDDHSGIDRDTLTAFWASGAEPTKTGKHTRVYVISDRCGNRSVAFHHEVEVHNNEESSPTPISE